MCVSQDDYQADYVHDDDLEVDYVHDDDLLVDAPMKLLEPGGVSSLPLWAPMLVMLRACLLCYNLYDDGFEEEKRETSLISALISQRLAAFHTNTRRLCGLLLVLTCPASSIHTTLV